MAVSDMVSVPVVMSALVPVVDGRGALEDASVSGTCLLEVPDGTAGLLTALNRGRLNVSVSFRQQSVFLPQQYSGVPAARQDIRYEYLPDPEATEWLVITVNS